MTDSSAPARRTEGATARPGQPAGPADLPQDELERFLYIITHDLRATFRAFQTLPDWIREDMGPLPPDRAEAVGGHLDMLTTQAARCDRMLLDLRDYSRVGRHAEPTTDHAVDEVIDRALALADLPGGMDVQVEGDGLLKGPGNELAMLFAALLSNASKHHDRETGEVRITVAGTGPLRQVTVADDGPGIPARFHEAVFDLLRTLRPRDECEGSGMGLATARKITERLGGRISIRDTDAPRGTIVALTLPGSDPDRPHQVH